MNSKSKDKSFLNKKARFDYAIEDSFEAGIVLNGQEIKGIRAGQVNMTSSYVKILGGELFWLGGDIKVNSGDNQRTRKLLVKKTEIRKLIGKTSEKGLTLVALKLYIVRGKAKLEVGVGKGKQKHDKREDLKKKDIRREQKSV